MQDYPSGAWINIEMFDLMCNEVGLDTDADRARALGVSHSTVRRLRARKTTPSLKFALRCKNIFGLRAFHLFDEKGAR